MATVSLGSNAGKWVMVSTILASSMAFIDGTALNVVLPALQKGPQCNHQYMAHESILPGYIESRNVVNIRAYFEESGDTNELFGDPCPR